MATKEEVEEAKWVHEQNKQDANRAHDRDTTAWHQANDAAIASATVALRTLVLINGGAAVTVLTFIGSLVGKAGVTPASLSQTTGECQESCVWCRVDHYASENLSSKIMAKWVFAGVHSRGGIIQPFAV